ncbi:AAA family ATPase [Sulfidibacter corallicola]|uniref:AAA family ATPase n=1 Tax=Sulfidibacter corallicola TaxID=2818388 RepID=A0A8A4TL73_SULCO|nr:AAA family ATPase [Sulfidibacter corallicola]QTD50749.1 AAA family ATPase [Sulfidibacter corallicola]
MSDEFPIHESEIDSFDPAPKRYDLHDLYLDPNNYRLINHPDFTEVQEADIQNGDVQRRTAKLLCGPKNQHIQDLLNSFKKNGYLPVDQIQIRRLPSDGFVIVEGNRRIAALKHLETERKEKGIELGELNPEIFQNVPVVIYEDSNELHHLTLMALKHISGNKKWAEWNQAKLLEKLSNEYQLDEEEICSRIGISKVELRRSLRALSLCAQYRDSDYGDQFQESLFSIFREAVRLQKLKEWLEWDDRTYKANNEEHRNLLFSLMSQEPDETTDDEGRASYADHYLEPAITKRDDLRTLSELLDDDRAMDKIIHSRDLNAAYRASNLVFRERQKASLEEVSRAIETLSQLNVAGDHVPELEQNLGRLQSIVERTRATDTTGVEQRAVFHDRIDRHFSKIKVIAYKRLQGLSLEKLSRINLVAGLNNTGKTTLLEAIYLLCRQNDFSGLLETQRRRGKIPEDKLDAEWFAENLPDEICVSGVYDNTKCSVEVRNYLEENSEIDRAHYLKSIEITTNFGGRNQESVTRMFKGRKRETRADGIKLLCASIFSSPFFLNEPHRYMGFYHKSVQSKSLPMILKFIEEKVVPTLTDVRLVDEWQRFLVTDSQFESTLDLTEYGEGLQRIFFISLLFASARNGVVLIDEFENAIHANLITGFAGFIAELSLLFNVQVFLTTHSKECIDAFVKNLPESTGFSACALVEKAVRIEACEFSGERFRRLVEAGDVDLRRAR